jgi:hypothetical protein
VNLSGAPVRPGDIKDAIIRNHCDTPFCAVAEHKLRVAVAHVSDRVETIQLYAALYAAINGHARTEGFVAADTIQANQLRRPITKSQPHCSRWRRDTLFTAPSAKRQGEQNERKDQDH